MPDTIKINFDDLEDAAQQVRTAYEQFTAISKSGFGAEIDALSGMNSDFVDKLIRVLEIAQDWNAETLNENILGYIQDAEAVCAEMKRVDEEIAGAYKGEE